MSLLLRWISRIYHLSHLKIVTTNFKERNQLVGLFDVAMGSGGSEQKLPQNRLSSSKIETKSGQKEYTRNSFFDDKSIAASDHWTNCYFSCKNVVILFFLLLHLIHMKHIMILCIYFFVWFSGVNGATSHNQINSNTTCNVLIRK